MESMRQDDEDAQSVHFWLQSHGHRFKGRVFGPIFLELQVDSMNHARQLETLIERRDLLAFVCEKAKDLTKLIKLTRKRGWKVNGVCWPAHRPPRVSTLSLSEVNHLGFTTFLTHHFNGPPPVVNFLINSYGLDNVAIAPQTVDLRFKPVPSPLTTYITGTNVHRIMGCSIVTEELVEANILVGSVREAGSRRTIQNGREEGYVLLRL